MEDSLINFLIIWFIGTILVIGFWIIGHFINERKPRQETLDRNFIIYVVVTVIAFFLLYLFVTLINSIIPSSSPIDKQTLRDTVLAIFGGILGAISYA